MKKKKKTLKDVPHYIRKNNIIGISEREGNEKGTKSLVKEITDENFPSLGKEMDFKIEEANRIPNYINTTKKQIDKNTL